MTGHQQNPTTGYNIKGDPAGKINLEALCRAMGFQDVYKRQTYWFAENGVCSVNVNTNNTYQASQASGSAASGSTASESSSGSRVVTSGTAYSKSGPGVN